MTCRGSRFKDGLEIEREIPLPDGTIWYKPKDSQEYLDLRANKFREWWRKWGTNVLHNDLMMPLVAPKYDIGFVVKNCDEKLLELLEPWCSTIYVDTYAQDYIDRERQNTLFDLNHRIYSIDVDVRNDIEVRFDGSKFNENSFKIIQNLSQILANDEELEEGSFELDIFEIDIKKIKTYEKDRIFVQKNLDLYV
tara:strand:+ start:61 stop:642 length:582 start_codon:yes stop_codon:yes gene_type:complete